MPTSHSTSPALRTGARLSIGARGMIGLREHDPHRAGLLAQVAPDPARTGYLVLPLLELLPPDHSGCQLAATQPVLCRWLTRCGSPRSRSKRVLRGPGALAQSCSAIGGVTGPKSKLPVPASRWRRDALAAALWRSMGQGAASLRLSGSSIGAVSRAASSGSPSTGQLTSTRRGAVRRARGCRARLTPRASRPARSRTPAA